MSEGIMKIKCENIEIINVEFTKNINFQGGENEIPIELQSDYAVSKDPEEKTSRLILHFKIADREQKYPFYCKIDVVGFFGWDEMEEKDAQEEIEEKGSEILFSFIRTYVYDLMQKSGMDPLILPIEHFNKE